MKTVEERFEQLAFDARLIKEDKIPKGIYCYDENGQCPYWQKLENANEPEAYCHYLEMSDGDIENRRLSSLLWDQCKECGVNE